MGKLVTSAVKKHFKKTMQQLVRDLSQPLKILQETPFFVDCPNCIWDSINKKSSNVFNSAFVGSVTIFTATDQERTITPAPFTSGRCPVCIGEGQLFTQTEICIPAMINFINPSESGGKYVDLPAGREGVNFAVVKTLACHYDLLARNSIFIVHNHVKCEKFRPPFVRGLGGEEAITEMIIQTTEVGEISSGKFGPGPDPLQNRTEDPRRKIKGPSDLRILQGQVRGQ